MVTTVNEVRMKVRQVAELRKDAWYDFPLIVEYDNLKVVNFETQSDPFVRITCMFQSGEQADLAVQPIHRVMGTIVIEAWDQVGKGNIKMDRLLDHFYNVFHMTDANPPLRTYAARITTRPDRNNWTATAALIPFWYDSFPSYV